ncbi:hypothetical protein Mapa_014040 [Marchantia paleacea]|nr:hypothetical protein Mapa_014040 [Marchantia paleacea]
MKQDTEMGEATNGYIGTPGTVPVSHAGNDSGMRRMRTASILMRLTAMALCVTALVTMVTDKQTHYFNFASTTIVKTAEYTNVLALKVFVYANGVVAGYSLLQALWTILAKSSYVTSKGQLWTTFFLDQLIVYVLIGVTAAATEVAYLAEKGEADVAWPKQCNNFGRFCSQVGASVIVCFAAILTLVFLAVVSAKQLFSHERPSRTTRKDGYYTSNQ